MFAFLSASPPSPGAACCLYCLGINDADESLWVTVRRTAQSLVAPLSQPSEPTRLLRINEGHKPRRKRYWNCVRRVQMNEALAKEWR